MGRAAHPHNGAALRFGSVRPQEDEGKRVARHLPLEPTFEGGQISDRVGEPDIRAAGPSGGDHANDLS